MTKKSRATALLMPVTAMFAYLHSGIDWPRQLNLRHQTAASSEPIECVAGNCSKLQALKQLVIAILRGVYQPSLRELLCSPPAFSLR